MFRSDLDFPQKANRHMLVSSANQSFKDNRSADERHCPRPPLPFLGCGTNYAQRTNLANRCTAPALQWPQSRMAQKEPVQSNFPPSEDDEVINYQFEHNL
jgi:hypothetical protein